MKISIVVPAFNEEKLIGATLDKIKEAAKAFPEAGCERELVVCNNNSTDRTEELARAAGAKVVFEPINQIGRARNAALLACAVGYVFVALAQPGLPPLYEAWGQVAYYVSFAAFIGAMAAYFLPLRARLRVA